MVIEWPSRLSLAIEDALTIQLEYLGSGGRKISLTNSKA